MPKPSSVINLYPVPSASGDELTSLDTQARKQPPAFNQQKESGIDKGERFRPWLVSSM